MPRREAKSCANEVSSFLFFFFSRESCRDLSPSRDNTRLVTYVTRASVGTGERERERDQPPPCHPKHRMIATSAGLMRILTTERIDRKKENGLSARKGRRGRGRGRGEKARKNDRCIRGRGCAKRSQSDAFLQTSTRDATRRGREKASARGGVFSAMRRAVRGICRP